MEARTYGCHRDNKNSVYEPGIGYINIKQVLNIKYMRSVLTDDEKDETPKSERIKKILTLGKTFLQKYFNET